MHVLMHEYYSVDSNNGILCLTENVAGLYGKDGIEWLYRVVSAGSFNHSACLLHCFRMSLRLFT